MNRKADKTIAYMGGGLKKAAKEAARRRKKQASRLQQIMKKTNTRAHKK